MLFNMFSRHVVTLFMILIFSVKLLTKKSFRDTETKYFWITVVSCLLLVLEDSLESLAAEDPSLRFFRILLSVLGYTLRSTAALGLLLVISPERERKLRLWIPSVITFLVCGTAFFTDVAFGFNENYEFYRGPLGYIAYIVPIFYMLLILIITLRDFSERSGIERIIPVLCVIFCLSATAADTIVGGVHLNEAIIASSVFFYVLLYFHDNRRDTLTGLLNRQSFYDDCITYERSIGAVASLDMNGLKTLNDSLGHQAGDAALKTIGECLDAVTDRNTAAYRIGGDEFEILFFHDREEDVLRTEEKVKADVAKRGYSISSGYFMRGDHQDLDEAVIEADHRMYANKAAYYQTGAKDRRRRREPREP